MDGEFKIDMKKVLIPVNLLGLCFLLFFGIQLDAVLRERDSLSITLAQQERPFAESQKLQSQLSALLIGAQKLLEAGDLNVKPILEQLKQMGVAVNTNPHPTAREASKDDVAPVANPAMNVGKVSAPADPAGGKDKK